MTGTTVISATPGGQGYGVAGSIFATLGGAPHSPVKLGWAYNSGSAAWEGRYSSPTVTCANVSGSGSGPTPTGLVTSGAAAPSIGGFSFGGYAYAWTYVSGDAGIACSNAAISDPTWSETIGVGTTSAIWQLTVTDDQTGATTSTTILVSLSWTQTASFAIQGTDAYNDFQISYSNSYLTQNVSATGSVTPVNNVGGVSYNWRYVSGDAGIAINDPTLQSPTWNKDLSTSYNLGPVQASAVWSCFAVDSINDNASTAINVTLKFEILNGR